MTSAGPERPPAPGGGSRTAADLGEVATAISRDVNSIYGELFGRGAGRTRTHLGEEFVLTILEGTLTTAEETLLAAGNETQILDTRRAFHKTSAHLLAAVAEEHTGRRVRSLHGDTDLSTGTAVELFLLE